MDEFTEEIRQRLLSPFRPEEIETRPGDGGKRFAFVDARAVMRRLDEVVGPAGWSFTYEVVRCEDSLSVVKGRLVVLGAVREDAGEARAAGSAASVETLKAAVSDAIKRTAVQIGVGRLLYELGPGQGQPTAQVIADAARRAGWNGGDHGGSSNRAPSEQPRGARTAAPKEQSAAPPNNSDTRALSKMLADAYKAAYADPTLHSLEHLTAACGVVLGRAVVNLQELDAEEAGRCIEAFREEAGEHARAQAEETAAIDAQVAEDARINAESDAQKEQSREALEADSSGPICSMPNCGKPLTQAQYKTSLQGFGTGLCPGCQRRAARTG